MSGNCLLITIERIDISLAKSITSDGLVTMARSSLAGPVKGVAKLGEGVADLLFLASLETICIMARSSGVASLLEGVAKLGEGVVDLLPLANFLEWVAKLGEGVADLLLLLVKL